MTYMRAGPKHGPVVPWHAAGMVKPSAKIWVPDDEWEHIGSKCRCAGHGGQQQEIGSHASIGELPLNEGLGQKGSVTQRRKDDGGVRLFQLSDMSSVNVNGDDGRGQI
jgi:hypothetical protein